MKANCWHGKKETSASSRFPIPRILNQRDAIVKITSTAICGSDLHLYNGFMPTMEKGDILGHEFMGEVVEVGPRSEEPAASATASSCRSRSRAATASACERELFSLCENSNPNAWMAEKMMGHSPGRHLRLLAPARRLRRRPGRVRARAVRRRRPAQGPRRTLRDEQVLFLSDILPTGYMGAEMCDIKPGDTIAVWGCGPVGQFAIASAMLLGAERVDRDRSLRRPPRDGAQARGRDGRHQLRGRWTSTTRSWR